MAEVGIDRKADERMEFTTSKDVTVAPTFQVRYIEVQRYKQTADRTAMNRICT
jgi:hypothetical protein